MLLITMEPIMKRPKKRKGGAPATGKRPMIGLRLADEVTVKIDEWADKHGIPTRSEAIRRMIDKVLEQRCGEQA
jgi:hypothetical protein